MNCEKFNSLIEEYIDDTLSDETKKEFEKHLEECDSCKIEFNNYKKIVDRLSDLNLEELPEGYCKRLHKKLEAEEISRKKKSHRIILKYGSLAACLVILLTVGVYNLGNSNFRGNNYYVSQDTAASDETLTDSYYDEEFGNEMSMDESVESGIQRDGSSKYNIEAAENSYNNNYNDSSNDILTSQKELKIIKSGNISVITDNYDEFMSAFEAIITSIGGYFQNNNSYIYNRSYNDGLAEREYKRGDLTIRIPNDKFDYVIEQISDLASIEQKNLSDTDVTKQYYDMDNKVKNLEIQEESLRNLYSKAENLTEILQLETAITNVRNQIDSYQNTLSDLDDRASYSTLQINLTESENIAIQNPKDFGERARDGFIKTVNSILSGFQNLAIWIISNIIYLAIVLIIIFVIYKKTRKKIDRK